MSSQDLIKFLTREFVQYVDTPKTERMKKKEEKKLQKENWASHWFGILPMSFKMWVTKRRK